MFRCFVLALTVLAASAAWENIQPNIAMIAQDIAAPSEDVVWSGAMESGRGPFILRSTDGGATFERLNSDPNFNMAMFLSTAALNDQRAAIGGMGFFDPVQYTLDGQTFRHTEPFLQVGMTQSIEAVPGTDASYVQVGDPYGSAFSTDAGVTFTAVPLDEPLRGTTARFVSPVNERVWIATGSRSNGNNNAEGMPTWAGEKSQGLVRSGNSTKHVMLWGKESNRAAVRAWTNTVAKTTDAGATWENIFIDEGAEHALTDISCPSENICFALGPRAEVGRILRSTDGGATWTLVQGPMPSTELYSIEFVSEREGFACGAQLEGVTFNALFLHTTDGGETWTPTRVQNQMCQSLSMVNNRVGYAVTVQPLGEYSIFKYTADQ